MARLACFPVLLFVFLGVHAALLAPASHGARLPSTYNTSMCLESIKCGSVVIRYPFYLSNATESTSDGGGSFSCGYTDLKISCQEKETPIIQLGPEYYTVRDITYSSSTGIIRLVDGNVFSGGSCPAVSHNVSFEEVWLKYTSSSYSWNLTFFYGCPPAPEAGPLRSIYEEYQISCTGFRNPFGGGPISLVSPTGMLDTAREQDLAAYCQKIITVPVSGEIPNATDNPFTSGGYGVAIKRGFNLAWSQSRRPTDGCARCEGPGSAGRCAYGQDRRFLGCLCSDGTVGCWCSSGTVATEDCKSDHEKRNTVYLIAISLGLPLLSSLYVIVFYLTRKRGYLPSKSKDAPRIESFLKNNRNLHPKRYKYAEVKRITKSFSLKLGRGGFSDVYKGNLSDGRHVAVKMLKDTKGEGQDFMNEVASISRTSHVNIVTLLGFCLEGRKRALIYEYMPNGSLERYAFKKNFGSENTLTWEKLFDIVIGIARGLEYLHRGCNTRIVHFDIKPHNILLNQYFCPKISDFGLAKLCLNKESVISIACARGTIGYIAPEVYSKQFGTISSKSDVYSYGMMVLEMVGARDMNVNANSESSSQYFPRWIYEHIDEYCISASEINGETTELVRKMIVVGLWCIQLVPTDRPTMTRVLEMLEGSTSNLELPPKVMLS